MKLLLCVSSLRDIEATVLYFNVPLKPTSSLPFLYSGQVLHHEVEVLETGLGLFQSSYKITKALVQQKYHLALKFSFGNSYRKEIENGTILNIINEKPADVGIMQQGWKDLYDLNLLQREEAPHVRGGFINMTNAYLHIFSPFKKVVGVSVNHYANKNEVAQRIDKYKADVETGDGVGFSYACLFENQRYYHLCAVERNLVSGEENFHLAQQKLNETLIDLLQKI